MKGRLDATDALARGAHAIAANVEHLPRMLWPWFLATTASETLILTGDAGSAAVLLAALVVVMAVNVMAFVAICRLILIGPRAARVPAIGWGRPETRTLLWFLVLLATALGCLVLAFALTALVEPWIPMSDTVAALVGHGASMLLVVLLGCALFPFVLKLVATAVEDRVRLRDFGLPPRDLLQIALLVIALTILSAADGALFAWLRVTLDPLSPASLAVAVLRAIVMGAVGVYVMVVSCVLYRQATTPRAAGAGTRPSDPGTA